MEDHCITRLVSPHQNTENADKCQCPNWIREFDCEVRPVAVLAHLKDLSITRTSVGTDEYTCDVILLFQM